jgi:ATP-dependent Zn protease
LGTGAADDIERAARIERRMVTQLGMSERLRPVAFGRKQQIIFLGREIGEQKDYSDRLRRRQVATAADTALAKRSAFHFSIMVG